MSKFDPICIECGATTTGQKQRCKPCAQKGINSGTANGNWSGEKIGYHGLHLWVKRHLPKPEKCEDCGLVPPRDLANKGTYDRELSNWEWLCRRCHMLKDGRMKNLRQFA